MPSSQSAAPITCLFLAAIVFVSRGYAASFCTHDPVPDDTKQQFEFLAGYSPSSATLIGTTEDRRFVIAGFEYSYRCWAWRNNSISFTPGILPAAILFQPAQYLYTLQDGFYAFRQTPSHAVYGFAILPVGFTFDFARRRAVHPFLETRGGIIASTEPIPIDTIDATALNFIFDFGGGLQWTVTQRNAISFGYKFLHISNANTTATNPGVDNNVFYAGFSFLR
ncbi:MAG: acyloxyacyl hydrolase [Acidobacteriaceae bacterium]|nr:acyloxyacyl hydrolase [Acidobacteriaceae bacterium]